jgi:predicted RND superfamily exporter protein
MRPVCMVVITTVLGMIPLLKDPFFDAMAVCIMFGLTFAAFLSLIVTPVMYAIFFSVQEQPLVAHPEQQDGEPPRMPRPSMAPKT